MFKKINKSCYSDDDIRENVTLRHFQASHVKSCHNICNVVVEQLPNNLIISIFVYILAEYSIAYAQMYFLILSILNELLSSCNVNMTEFINSENLFVCTYRFQFIYETQELNSNSLHYISSKNDFTGTEKENICPQQFPLHYVILRNSLPFYLTLFDIS